MTGKFFISHIPLPRAGWSDAHPFNSHHRDREAASSCVTREGDYHLCLRGVSLWGWASRPSSHGALPAFLVRSWVSSLPMSQRSNLPAFYGLGWGSSPHSSTMGRGTPLNTPSENPITMFDSRKVVPFIPPSFSPSLRRRRDKSRPLTSGQVFALRRGTSPRRLLTRSRNPTTSAGVVKKALPRSFALGIDFEKRRLSLGLRGFQEGNFPGDCSPHWERDRSFSSSFKTSLSTDTSSHAKTETPHFCGK